MIGNCILSIIVYYEKLKQFAMNSKQNPLHTLVDQYHSLVRFLYKSGSLQDSLYDKFLHKSRETLRSVDLSEIEQYTSELDNSSKNLFAELIGKLNSKFRDEDFSNYIRFLV